jgi:hypothetical protein
LEVLWQLKQYWNPCIAAEGKYSKEDHCS